MGQSCARQCARANPLPLMARYAAAMNQKPNVRNQADKQHRNSKEITMMTNTTLEQLRSLKAHARHTGLGELLLQTCGHASEFEAAQLLQCRAVSYTHLRAHETDSYLV